MTLAFEDPLTEQFWLLECAILQRLHPDCAVLADLPEGVDLEEAVAQALDAKPTARAIKMSNAMARRYWSTLRTVRHVTVERPRLGDLSFLINGVLVELL